MTPDLQQQDPALDARVLAIIAQLTTVKPADITPKDRLREDLGMDSVCSMELLSMLAEELDVDVEVEEALQVTTVGAALELVRRRVAARRT